MNKKAFVFLIAGMLGAVLCAQAEAEGHETPHFDWVGFLGKLLNAAILFGGIFLFLRKPLIQFLYQRGFSIKKDIEEREEKIRKGAGDLDDIKGRLARIEEELEALKKDAAESGRQEMEHLARLGQEETGKIISRTEREIDRRIESAVKKLKSKIVEMAISQFTEDLQKKIDEKGHRKLIDRGIEGVKQLDERE